MAPRGDQLEAMATNMKFHGDLLQKILNKDTFMEVRSNYMGPDGEAVLKRQVMEELARCIAVKMQKSHEFRVKMTMLKPVLENQAQLEFALKTLELTTKDLTAAVQKMELLHKLEHTNTNRIGMGKPGDLCHTLKVRRATFWRRIRINRS